MRRRPKEYYREQGDRGHGHVATGRGPADHRGKGAGRAADDDVLRRPPFQPHGVDEDIKGDGHGQQRRRQDIDHRPHDQNRGERQHCAEDQGGAGLDVAAGDGPLAGAQHLAVNIGVVPHIYRARGPGAHGDAEQRHDGQSRMHAAWRQHQSDQGRKDNQAHHPGLQQGQIIGPKAKRTAAADPALFLPLNCQIAAIHSQMSSFLRRRLVAATYLMRGSSSN